MSGVNDLLASRQVIVCCGSGGVGKTTVAAALALSAARLGRRAVVITIDPARRLADALGRRGELSNEPTLVERIGTGEMWAAMLDVSTTFDELIGRFAATSEQADVIRSNVFYKSISGSLSGTRDYMAAEMLLRLHEDPRFDLVVLDTAPSRNALDFIESPEPIPTTPTVPHTHCSITRWVACHWGNYSACVEDHRQSRRFECDE